MEVVPVLCAILSSTHGAGRHHQFEPAVKPSIPTPSRASVRTETRSRTDSRTSQEIKASPDTGSTYSGSWATLAAPDGHPESAIASDGNTATLRRRKESRCFNHLGRDEFGPRLYRLHG